MAQSIDHTKIYATTDADGRATGFYDPAIRGDNIPEDSFPIEPALWQAWIADTHTQRWDNGSLVPCDPPAPISVVPDVISDRQFFQQLALDGDISQDEALAAVQTGTMPKKLSDVIGKLPTDQQFAAKMLVSGATEFHRSNEMVGVLGQALGKDGAALDSIWTNAFRL